MIQPSYRTNLLPLIAAAASVAFVSGCAVRSRTAVSPNLSSAANPDAASASPNMSAKDRERLKAIADSRRTTRDDSGYLIGPDDLLDVRIPDVIDGSASRATGPAEAIGPFIPVVAQAPIFQQGLRVDASGDITLPLIGQMKAAGLTPTGLELAIADGFVKKHILRAPQVSVQVVEYRSRVAAVVGSVERPGLYPLTRPGTTVGDLLWSAGGPSKEAGRIVEFAPATTGASENDSQPIRIDLDTLLRANGLRDHSLDPPVQPGDVITLSPAGSVLVDGWVQKPGAYPVTRGLTVSGVIAAAGGDLFPANLRKLTIARADGAYQESVRVDLDAISSGRAPDVPIADGDVVRIPVRPILVVPWGVWTLIRDMVRLGGSVPVY